MLSVIIATENSERPLVPTLAALVAGALAGVVREVIVADAGSRDETAAVADVAGCRIVVSTAPAGVRLKAAAAQARGPWLLFLRPGAVPDATWVDEVGRFVQDAERAAREGAQAAVFRAASVPTGGRALADAARALISAALGAHPHPQQGLLIAKEFYDRLGGHATDGIDPEPEFLRRLGRRRIVTLRSAVTTAVV
jgi:Glycosyl transferase family 2